MIRKFYEETKRSFTKAITFRALIIISDSVIVFTITHRWDATLGVMLGSNIASTIIYFLHERLWNNVHWGKTHEN